MGKRINHNHPHNQWQGRGYKLGKENEEEKPASKVGVINFKASINKMNDMHNRYIHPPFTARTYLLLLILYSWNDQL